MNQLTFSAIVALCLSGCLNTDGSLDANDELRHRRQPDLGSQPDLATPPDEGPPPPPPGNGRVFYIDYEAGTDSNDGRSRATPWMRHPYMNGFAGAYGHRAGDHFIFKGGVTWRHEVFEMRIEQGGTANLPDYYGVDPTWFSGPAWTRPIFTGEHDRLGSGDNLVFIRATWVVLANIELKEHRSFEPWGPASVQVACSPNVLLTHLRVHDWSLDPSVTTDDAHGGVIGVYWGGCSSIGTWLDHSEVSNTEAQA